MGERIFARGRLVAILTLVAAVAPTAIGNPSGSWRGTMTGRATICNASVPVGGAFELTLMSNGSQVSGAIAIPVWINVCTVRAAAEMLTMQVSGSMSGAGFEVAGSASSRDGDVSFTVRGSVAADLMTLSWSGGGVMAGVSGDGLASRTDAPPASYSGTWRGTGYGVVLCGERLPDGSSENVVGISMTPTIAAVLTQSNSSLSGTYAINNLMNTGSSCKDRWLSDETHSFTAVASGHAFTANAGGTTLSATVDGGRMLVFFVTPGVSTGSVTLVRTAEVAAFVASTSTIVKGQSAVLTWAAINATGVVIDNDIGAQPPSGSLMVTPSTTTTYTLTALGGDGPESNASAAVTITVKASPPKRRSVRH